jgi:hypothetical protein
MGCENCKNGSGQVYSIIEKTPGGLRTKFVSREVALASGAYCEKHDIPHTIFDWGEKGACVMCVDEMVRENEYRAIDLLSIFLDNLPILEFARLLERFKAIQEIVADSNETCLLRALAVRAKCVDLTIDKVMEQVIEAQSVDIILPCDY